MLENHMLATKIFVLSAIGQKLAVPLWNLAAILDLGQKNGLGGVEKIGPSYFPLIEPYMS